MAIATSGVAACMFLYQGQETEKENITTSRKFWWEAQGESLTLAVRTRRDETHLGTYLGTCGSRRYPLGDQNQHRAEAPGVTNSSAEVRTAR